MYLVVIAVSILVIRMIIRSNQVFDFQKQICRCMAVRESNERSIWNQIMNKVSHSETLSEREKFVYNTFGGDTKRFEAFLNHNWKKIVHKNSFLKLCLSGKPLRLINFYTQEEITLMAS